MIEIAFAVYTLHFTLPMRRGPHDIIIGFGQQDDRLKLLINRRVIMATYLYQSSDDFRDHQLLSIQSHSQISVIIITFFL